MSVVCISRLRTGRLIIEQQTLCQMSGVSSSLDRTYGDQKYAGVYVSDTPEFRAALAPHVGRSWSLDQMLILCARWRAGFCASEIGAVLGVSNYAVTGKAHRLAAVGLLIPRRDPSKATPDPSSSILRYRQREADRKRRAELAEPRTHANGPTARDAAALSPRTESVRLGRVRECVWPIGTPGQRGFRYCDVPLPRDGGKSPYCPDHQRTAYIGERGHAAPLAGTGAELSGSGPP
jgi:hypothetical protein